MGGARRQHTLAIVSPGLKRRIVLMLIPVAVVLWTAVAISAIQRVNDGPRGGSSADPSLSTPRTTGPAETVEASSPSSSTATNPATTPESVPAETSTSEVTSQTMPSTVTPSPPGDGSWSVAASTAAGPVVWESSNRPLAAQPDVTASYASFDPTRLHAALFNGTELPGGGPWNNGSKVMAAAQPALLAAFNGGFRFKHIKGGYFTESQVVKPLIDGDATLAIGADGRIVLGAYGRDLTNDGSWVSLRQNLPPVIDGGREVVSTAREQGSPSIYWGDDYGHVTLDRRSAICRRVDGLIMYVVTERVDIRGLADVLLAAHCDFAMELDINGSWPQFVSFTPSTGARAPVGLTPEMTHLSRVTTGSTKDFIALFDPALLPPGVVK